MLWSEHKRDMPVWRRPTSQNHCHCPHAVYYVPSVLRHQQNFDRLTWVMSLHVQAWLFSPEIYGRHLTNFTGTIFNTDLSFFSLIWCRILGLNTFTSICRKVNPTLLSVTIYNVKKVVMCRILLVLWKCVRFGCMNWWKGRHLIQSVLWRMLETFVRFLLRSGCCAAHFMVRKRFVSTRLTTALRQRSWLFKS